MRNNLFFKLSLTTAFLWLFMMVPVQANSGSYAGNEGYSSDFVKLENFVFSGLFSQTETFAPMADFIPTAGATETFNPAVGDFFFDPGGPGGGPDGSPGNYPNCGCATQTTLAGVSEIEIIEMDIFANFDYLRIYDGTDTSGTLLYGNGAGDPDDGDYGLPSGTVLNAASGNFFFYFHASTVVNRLGWEIEITGADGGGGSDYCIPEGTNANRYVDNFSTTGGTDNISNMGSGFSAGGYGDFYDTHGVIQEQGSDVSFEVDIEGGTAGFRIWVDWNQDGVFDTTEEVAWNSNGYANSHSGTFTVPADANLGDTRMRIVSHWLSTTGDVDPCATGFTYGEFEDYKFTVLDGGGGTPPGEDCEWTVHVWHASSFGDEVDWTLKDADGTVLLSGGGYGFSYDDTQTVVAEGPLEFYISTIDFWNDNEANYTVHNGTEVVASGYLDGGEDATHSDLNCDGGGGGDPGPGECGVDFPHSNADGTGNVVTLLFADDFKVDPGVTFNVEEASFRMFHNIGEATVLAIHEDNGGEPGAAVESFSNLAPDSQTVIDNNFSMDIYDVKFTLPTAVELTEGNYWFVIQVTEGTSGAGTRYWTIAQSGYGQPGKYSADGGDTWTVNSSAYNFSFTLEGECDGAGGGTDPEPGDCEQDYYAVGMDPVDYPNGVGFSNGNKVANDVVIAPNSTFEPHTLTFDALAIAGNMVEFTIQLHEDNGSGGVGDEVGPAYVVGAADFDSTFLGNWSGAYPLYRIVIDISSANIVLTNDTDDPMFYWVSIASELSSTGDFTYWNSYPHPGNSSNPTWVNFTSSGGVWAAHTDNLEGAMLVEGICYGEGGEPDPGDGFCDEVFTEDAADPDNFFNTFAGVTFDLVNDTAEDMTITGLKVPVSGMATLDLNVWVTTTSTTNVGVHTNPAEWTLVEEVVGIPANNATDWDLSTFTQVDLSEEMIIPANSSRGVYVYASSYGAGTSYHYTNGNFTATDGNLSVLSNGFGSNATEFGNTFADRAFVGEVQYCIGEGGGTDPEPGDDCEQDYYISGMNPANYDNGLNITDTTTSFWGANDVVVEAGVNFKVETITFDAISLAGNPTGFKIQIHEDNGSGGVGAPVGPVYTFGPADYTYTTSGSYSGYDVFRMVFDVSGEDINFDNTSGTDDGYWWIAIQADPTSAASSLFWLVDYHDGNPSNLMWTAQNGVWAEYADDDYEGAMLVEGICSENGGTDPEPEPDCEFEITSTVEPITHVVFAGIDNTSSAVIDGSPALEDFTDIEGNVEAGGTYDIALEGNTAGSWTNHFTAFIKWNEGDSWTDYSTFEVGSISNSTGTDGQQAINTITIPADAAEGAYTMRIVKNFNTSPLDPCGTYSWGQAEDYTIIVGEGDGPIEGECSQEWDSADPDVGVGFANDNRVANDIIIDAQSTFTLQTITMEVVVLAGQPTEFDLEIYTDDGGIVDSPTGDTFHFDSASGNMSFTPNGLLFDVYPRFTVELTMPGAGHEFVNDTDDDVHYWLSVNGGLSTTGDFSYWIGYAYDFNTSHPTWQYTPAEGWFEYLDSAGGSKEGLMKVEGICATLGISDLSSFDFTYYPNPVKDVLYINSSKKVESVQVYNLAGQEVMKETKQLSTANQIDVTTLPSGVYIFRAVLDGGAVENFKVIKK